MFDNAQTWRASMQDVEADIEDEFGEPLLITPVVPANRGQASPLPAEAQEVRGVFSNRATLALKPGKGATAADVGTIVDSRKTQAKLSFAALDSLGFAVVRGTLIERLECGEVYEVGTSAPDGVSCVAFDLRQLGRPNNLSGLTEAKVDLPAVEAPAGPTAGRWFTPTSKVVGARD